MFQGEHGRFFKFAAVLTGIALVILTFGPGNNIIRWIGAGMEISRQKKQAEEYEMQIRSLDNKIKMLQSNRDTLEKFAREQFYFTEPGDDVYIIEEK